MRWPWMYKAPQGRDLRIDFLRGYALFMMIVDHVGPEWLPNNQGGQSYLYNLTGATMFYASAAEIFYLVSGLTLGLVCASSAFEQAVKRILGRTWTLYYTVILMSLGFSALYHVFPGINLWSIYDQAKQNYVAFALQTLTLQVTGHGSEILVLYVIFMMFTPLALWMLFMRRWYMVVLASAVIYAIAQIFPDYQNSNFTLTTYFPTFTWQPLFFLGLVIGFHRQDLARAWDRLPPLRTVLEVSVVFVALAFLWVFVNRFALWPELPVLLGGFDDQGHAIRESMTPVRLALVLLYIQAAYILISWLWTPLHRALGWLLEVLGRQSLWAFVTHMAVYVVLHNLAAFNNHAGNYWWWQLLGVLIVWGFIRVYEPLARLVFARAKTPISTHPTPVQPLEYPMPKASRSKGWIESDDALFLRESTNRTQDSLERGVQVRREEFQANGTHALNSAAETANDQASSSRKTFRGSRWQPRGELIGAAPISRALQRQAPIRHLFEIAEPNGPDVPSRHIPSDTADSVSTPEGLDGSRSDQRTAFQAETPERLFVESPAEFKAETTFESRHEQPSASVLEPALPEPIHPPALERASEITTSEYTAEEARSDTTGETESVLEPTVEAGVETTLETPVKSGVGDDTETTVEDSKRHQNETLEPLAIRQSDQEPVSAQVNQALVAPQTPAGKPNSSKKKSGSGKKNSKKRR